MRPFPKLLAGAGIVLLTQSAPATAEPFTLLIYESEAQLAARTDPSQARPAYSTPTMP